MATIGLTKDLLLNGLNNILNNLLYGLVSPRLVASNAWVEASRGAALFKGPEADIQVHLGPLSKRVIDPTLRDGFIRNYENSLLRAMLRESHELILLHCEETQQFPVYKAEPWFQFARILRNVVSHKQGGVLRKWPTDLLRNGVTSVTWRHRKFETGMLGTEVTFYLHEGLLLLRDETDFVAAKLS